MNDKPDISRVASLIGDPVRANMLTSLMSGGARTASELAQDAGITAQTASSHLSKMKAGGLISARKQGRHQYFELANADVADILERLMGLAERSGHTRTRPGPKDPAMRKARVCYNHLAGDAGVQLFDGLTKQRLIKADDGNLLLTPKGELVFQDFGIDLSSLKGKRRPLCKECLDWSVRRTHLAGSLGTALLDRFYELKWATRVADSRTVKFSPLGQKKFNAFVIGT
jgi:DNA-binding transcriptional ArsR family regulator